MLFSFSPLPFGCGYFRSIDPHSSVSISIEPFDPFKSPTLFLRVFFLSSGVQKRTIDRLLQKKESKPNKSSNPAGNSAGSAAGGATSTGASTTGRVAGAPAPGPVLSRSYTWKQTCDGQTTFSLPIGASFPLSPQKEKEPPVAIQCGVPGCSNPKRYSCSKTIVPLCSLECYRTNLKLHERST